MGDFEPIGPRLPIEFCRISRDGRLTLVIDESFGVPCTTYSALSAFGDLNAAIENLRDREGMPTTNGVGFTVANGSRQSREQSNATRKRSKPSLHGSMRMASTPQSGQLSEAISPRKQMSHSRLKLQFYISRR
jgi:hypothetical protein